MLVVNRGIHRVSFDPPSQMMFDETIQNVIDSLPKFDDDASQTCDDVSEAGFINIVWELFGDTKMINSSVLMKGSQPCRASNIAWFVRGRVPGRSVIQCNVTETQNMGLRICNLFCHCACGNACAFLHFQVQNPPWMNKTLRLCHYERYYFMP